MDAADRVAYDSQRKFENKEVQSGCYAPFVSLYFNTYGEVLACCRNATYVLGNVAHDRLGDIWHGQRIKALRQSLAEYTFGAGCESCAWEIAGGNLQGAFPAVFEDFSVGSSEPEWPAQIEFAGSNSCNFECVMCSGEFSSSIRAHRDVLPPLPKVYSDQFFQDLRAFLPHLRRARFLGGEPFLAEECFRIWDMILEDRLSLRCHVTTNGSQYNARVERVLNALPVDICMSLDGATKETVERIRINCNYEEFLANVGRFREYARRRGTHFGFAHCLMRQNWHEFGSVLRFAEKMDAPVFVNTVMGEHSLYTLAPEELLRIADQMDRERVRGEDDLLINRGVWESQIERLRKNAHGRMTERLVSLQNAFDETWQERSDRLLGDLKKSWDLIAAGRYEEGLNEALKIPENHPYYFRSVITCSDARRLKGDLEGAERDLERCLKITRRRPEVFISRAWLRLHQGRLSEALADATLGRNVSTAGDGCEAGLRDLFAHLEERTGAIHAATPPLDGLVELKPAEPGG